MIEKVLEAYETERLKNNTFVDIIRGMNKLTRFLLVINIISLIVLIILLFKFKNIYIYVCFIIYYAFTYIETAILERVKHKRWKNNIEGYNKELNDIAEILKRDDFNLYEKVKIKQLICKFYQAIEREEQKNNSKSNENKNFVFTYIFPIVAFFAGKINTTIISGATEWIAFGVVIVGTVILVKYDYKNVVELVKMIGWNTLEKEKMFVLKLQDLLDRDFKIEQDDLLSSK